MILYGSSLTAGTALRGGSSGRQMLSRRLVRAARLADSAAEASALMNGAGAAGAGRFGLETVSRTAGLDIFDASAGILAGVVAGTVEEEAFGYLRESLLLLLLLPLDSLFGVSDECDLSGISTAAVDSVAVGLRDEEEDLEDLRDDDS